MANIKEFQKRSCIKLKSFWYQPEVREALEKTFHS